MRIATACVNGVCSCLLPLPTNDFRPLALRHRSLAFVSALLIGVKVIALLALALTPATAQLSTITVSRIVQLTNAERQKAGQGALTVSPKLAQAAQRKGEDMLAHDYFAHISPSGVTPWFWMQQQGYAYQVAGENLAIDFVEAEDVVAAWLASSTHRDNMLHASYSETGIAVVTGEFQGGTSTIVVHMFGLPAGGTPAKPAATAAPPAPTAAPATAGTKQVSPTATPAPVAPTAAPTAAPDTTPPRVPRIALAGEGGATVAHTLRLAAETEPESSLTWFINARVLPDVTGTDGGFELDVSEFPDGELVAQAHARDAAGNISSLSNPVRVRKDSAKPAIARSSTTFTLSPQTDAALVLASVDAQEEAQVHVQQSDASHTFTPAQPIVLSLRPGETVMSLRDAAGNTSERLSFTLMPHYGIEADGNFMPAPARLNHMSRWLAAAAFLLLLFLLIVAIFVRISVQRPALIAHTAAVILLAGVLFLI